MLRQNVSIAGERMMADLGLSLLQLGLVLSAFEWAYAIFQFPGGLFGDRLGARRALTLLAVLWGLLNLLVGLVPGRALVSTTIILASLVTLRFMMGIAQAPLFPLAAGGTTCRWFPVGGWALPNGLQNAGLAFGSAATGPLIAWLMVRVGWRQSFVLTAPLAFAFAAVWWWYARDNPAEHRGVNATELALIDAGRPGSERAASPPQSWKVLLKNRNVLMLASSYFCNNWVFYFFFNWLFIYLVDSRGFKLLAGGLYSSAPWVTGAVMAVLGGLTCDGLSRRFGMRLGCRLPAVAGMLLAAGFLVAAALAKNPYAAVLLLCLGLGSQQFTDAAYWAASISIGQRHASAACGVLNTGGNIVGPLVALVVPLLVRGFGWGVALATGSLFALVAALLWAWIRSDEPLRVSAVPEPARASA